jgi:hypothetical protein
MFKVFITFLGHPNIAFVHASKSLKSWNRRFFSKSHISVAGVYRNIYNNTFLGIPNYYTKKFILLDVCTNLQQCWEVPRME